MQLVFLAALVIMGGFFVLFRYIERHDEEPTQPLCALRSFRPHVKGSILQCKAFAILLLRIAAILLLIGSVVQYSRPRQSPGLLPNSSGYYDKALYKTIAERVQAGENYYAVAADEQRRHGFPTKPPFTIRAPTEVWFLAALRDDFVRRAAILILAVYAALQIRSALERHRISLPVRVAGVLLCATGLIFAAASPDAPYLHEVWAGLLIAIAVAAWRPERPGLSVAAAFAACLFREIAAPVLLVMAACAATERRWREVLLWSGATSALAVLTAFHLWLAARQELSGDLTSQGWMVMGSWPFVVETARRNPLLYLAPEWASSLLVALALSGFACANGAWGRRIATVIFAFAGMFWFAGRPENAYWGFLYTPLMPLGLVFALCGAFKSVSKAAVMLRRGPIRLAQSIRSCCHDLRRRHLLGRQTRLVIEHHGHDTGNTARPCRASQGCSRE
jgi:hypothetical protein